MTGQSLLTPGQRVGQHRVERLLGRGGIAEVYLVTELTFEVPQALKVMLDDDEDRARRLIREGRWVYALRRGPVRAWLEYPMNPHTSALRPGTRGLGARPLSGPGPPRCILYI